MEADLEKAQTISEDGDLRKMEHLPLVGVEKMSLAGSQLVKLDDVGFAGWYLARAEAVCSAY